MADFEPLRPPRFQREDVSGGFEFLIPARRNWFAIPFLTVWLIIWTIAGGAVVVSMIAGLDLFLFVWLLFWAFGWLFAFSTLAYMFTGREVIRCVGGNLEIGYRALLLSKIWRYRGNEVNGLAATDGPDAFTRMFTWGWSSSPIFAARRIGTIRFNHGARTIFAGNVLDRAEAELIVVELKRGLPDSH